MPIEGLAELEQEIRDFTQRVVPEEATAFQKQIVLDALGRCAKKTPVRKGRARGGWQATVGELPTVESGVRETSDNASGVIARGLAAIAQIPHYSVAYVSNNVVYIEVLEHGLYPDPPKHGTRIAKGDRKRHLAGLTYEQRSIGGFSKQAPQGMVAVTVEELRAIFE